METLSNENKHEQYNLIPKIYVASLADYNDGELHGSWINANQDTDDIYFEIDEILKSSAQPNAEEWAIHDYEGFGEIRISEFETIETVSTLGKGIGEHGLVFSHFVQLVGTNNLEDLKRFDDIYIGRWDSMEQYAQELLDDLGFDLDQVVPEFIRPYIRVDIESFARDLKYDLYVSEDSDGVYVFEI